MLKRELYRRDRCERSRLRTGSCGTRKAQRKMNRINAICRIVIVAPSVPLDKVSLPSSIRLARPN